MGNNSSTSISDQDVETIAKYTELSKEEVEEAYQKWINDPIQGSDQGSGDKVTRKNFKEIMGVRPYYQELNA